MRDRGYTNPKHWSAEGWGWKTFRNVKWPTFWIPDGPQGLHRWEGRPGGSMGAGNNSGFLKSGFLAGPHLLLRGGIPNHPDVSARPGCAFPRFLLSFILSYMYN